MPLGHVLETQQLSLASRLPPLSRRRPGQLGVTHAIGCSSGTDALWLALAAAGIGPGISRRHHPLQLLRLGQCHPARRCHPPSWPTSIRLTFNLDPAAVEATLDRPAWQDSERAILPVHLYGQCADWGRFARLGRERGLKLIEDAAQAWGAEWNGTKAGAIGRHCCLQLLPHQKPERRGRRRHGHNQLTGTGRARSDASPARNAPPLLSR